MTITYHHIDRQTVNLTISSLVLCLTCERYYLAGREVETRARGRGSVMEVVKKSKGLILCNFNYDRSNDLYEPIVDLCKI